MPRPFAYIDRDPIVGDEIEVSDATPFGILRVVVVASVVGQYRPDSWDVVDADGIPRFIHRGHGGYWCAARLEDWAIAEAETASVESYIHRRADGEAPRRT